MVVCKIIIRAQEKWRVDLIALDGYFEMLGIVLSVPQTPLTDGASIKFELHECCEPQSRD